MNEVTPARSFFITGSDTAVGKTLVATAILLAARKKGLRTLGIKPVSAGCEIREGRLVNQDALELQAAATVALDYETINPVALEPFLAPHIAAAQIGVDLSAAQLIEHFEGLRGLDAELVIVEGAGGWLVPLNAHETLADVCCGLGMPVIMVVSMRLGCLNHALLTAAAIRSSGLALSGWVANCAEPEMVVLEENVQSLKARLDAPLVARIPFMGENCKPEDIVEFIDLDAVLTAGR